MNKLLIFIFISFLLNNCSLNKNSKLWNEKEKIENENKNLKKILVEKKNVVSELNASLKLKKWDEIHYGRDVVQY